VLVCDMQVTAVHGVLPTASPQQAIEEMYRTGLTTLPVVNADDGLVGVITEINAHNLVSHGSSDDLGSHPRLEVRAAMTPPAPAIGMHDGLSHALRILGMVSWDALPVTDEGRLVGLLSRREAIAVKSVNDHLFRHAAVSA